MGSLFEKGNTVNSYRLFGNTHGFSITFQLCQPKSATPGISEYSPLTTPNSKKHYKSPSALKRDQIRIDNFIFEQESTPLLKGQKDEANSFLEKAVNMESETSTQGDKQELRHDMIDQDTQNDECTAAVSDEPEQEPCHREDENDAVITVKDKAEKKNEGESDNNRTSHDSKQGKEHGDDVQLPVDNAASADDKIEDKERLYKQNIQNKKRNMEYNKIVHDTRDEGSMVYGVTDDLVISVDENNCKYTSWAKHDKDKRCEEIQHLVERWPEANPKRCKYGIYSLNTILPEIVLSEQQSAAK